MLIYNKEGKLVACTTDDALKPLGFESVKEFFTLYEDISEIFIQKKGYIATYDNISWINFVFNDILPQKQVVVDVEGEEKIFDIIDTPLFSNDMQTVSITFTPADKEQIEDTPNIEAQDSVVQNDQSLAKPRQEVEKTAPTEQEETQQQPMSSEENEELLELLNLEEPSKEDKQLQEQDNQTQEQNSVNFDDLEEFELDTKEQDKQSRQDQADTQEQSKEESKQELEDLYDFDLDFSKEEQKEQEKPLEQEDSKQDQDGDEEFELDFEQESDQEKESAKKESEDKEQTTDQEHFELDFDEEQNEDPKEQPQESHEQYIDSKEHNDSKEVSLEKLSNELGLEQEECANFILDFTNMVLAKEKLLRGENASVEAASLKNIAENFRLHNIVKTLETIEEGEPNANLLFSQITKLQNELKPYTKEVENSQARQQNGAISWGEAKKTPIEFDPNVAAESLGLPTELISEFVVDFIEQAQESKESFDQAYAQNDIELIQENAHKLKGAAANLRIEPIASKLEELQHNDDIEKAPQMLKEFWGMYLGLKEVV